MLGLAMFNRRAKFDFSMSTGYEDMKADAKCSKWGGFGKSGISQGH